MMKIRGRFADGTYTSWHEVSDEEGTRYAQNRADAMTNVSDWNIRAHIINRRYVRGHEFTGEELKHE